MFVFTFENGLKYYKYSVSNYRDYNKPKWSICHVCCPIWNALVYLMIR